MSDDITHNYHGGNPESAEAHLATRKHHDTMRIIGLMRGYPQGLTCDEAEVLLNMRHQTCSARFADMKRDGLLVTVDIRRRTRAGCWARVHTLPRFAAAQRNILEVIAP
jgi:hypothetical protein